MLPPPTLHPEDGDSMDVWNVGVLHHLNKILRIFNLVKTSEVAFKPTSRNRFLFLRLSGIQFYTLLSS
jgi:hypothetical protein